MVRIWLLKSGDGDGKLAAEKPLEERLAEVFLTRGIVESAQIIIDRLTAKSKGFGFVVFNQPSIVAIAMLLDKVGLRLASLSLSLSN